MATELCMYNVIPGSYWTRETPRLIDFMSCVNALEGQLQESLGLIFDEGILEFHRPRESVLCRFSAEERVKLRSEQARTDFRARAPFKLGEHKITGLVVYHNPTWGNDSREYKGEAALIGAAIPTAFADWRVATVMAGFAAGSAVLRQLRRPVGIEVYVAAQERNERTESILQSLKNFQF